MTTRSFVVSRTELAGLIGCTPDTISRYIAEGLETVETGNGRGRVTRLDLGVAIKWILGRRTGTLDQARTRLATAQSAKCERENRVRMGELVAVEAVARDFAGCATVTKARLRRIPGAIADRVIAVSVGGPAAIKQLLLQEIDEALTELSRRADAPTTEAHG